MTIRREDLVAAAAVEILNSRQVEPLLVFLLQREVRATREAMLAQQRPERFGRINVWLSCVAGALALLTAVLFAVVFSESAIQTMSGGTLLLYAALYGGGAVVLIEWLRRRGLRARIRVLTVLAMASAPLAVVALHHVAG